MTLQPMTAHDPHEEAVTIPTTMPQPSRSRRVGALGAALVALLALLPLPALAEHGGEDPALEQRVSADEVIASGPASVDIGHLDIGPHADPTTGEWALLARDDSGDSPVWRRPEDLVIRLHDDALIPAPTEGAFAALGASEGEKWYVIPQIQDPDVVWLGWNTQDPGVVAALDRGATMKVGPMSGPGRSILFLQDGTFGEPLVLADSEVGAAQDVWVDANTHVHANWVFTQPGVHLAPVTFVAETRDGTTRTASAVLRFAVGDAVSDEEVRGAALPDTVTTTADAPTSGGAESGTAPLDAETDDARGDGNALIWAGIVLVLGALAALLALARRRATARDVEAARRAVAERAAPARRDEEEA